MNAAIRLLLVTGIVLGVLGFSAYFLRGIKEKRATRGTAASEASGGAVTLAQPPARGRDSEASGRWTPPEGDPVQRFRALKNADPQERYDLISNFMALGHERNPAMLIEALQDPVSDLRVFAIESASALTVEEATAVLRAGAANEHPDAREMTWSIAAPYPMESRVGIYAEALVKGNDSAMAEALEEMSVTPEMPLFEMMLFQSAEESLPPARRQRLMEEMQGWLEPGGGDVPVFSDPKDLLSWWEANRENYDEFLLRVDLDP